MNIKAIILDVDGTLTNSKKVITEKTKNALIKAQEKGIILILASGRLTSGVVDFATEVKMYENNGLWVSFNGSKVVDCQSEEVLINETMTVEQGKEVLEHMKKFKVKPMIDKNEYMFVNDVYDCYINHNNESINIIQYESRGGKFKLCEKEDLSSFVDYPLNKI